MTTALGREPVIPPLLQPCQCRDVQLQFQDLCTQLWPPSLYDPEHQVQGNMPEFAGQGKAKGSIAGKGAVNDQSKRIVTICRSTQFL